MWFVYVLELKPHGEGITKFYVGHTCRLQRRIHDHMTGRSVEWVGRRGVASVIQCIRTTADSALGLEVAKTTELKAKHGWQHVRGVLITILTTALSRNIGRHPREVSLLNGCVQDHR